MIRNSLRRQTLRFSQIEGSLWSLMVGAFETFVMYYVVKRGVSKNELAILASVPVLLGAIANWVIPHFTPNRFLKLGILILVAVQILGIVVIIFSIQAPAPFNLSLIGLSLYWIGALACSPLWTDWIAGWLPHERLGRFLGRRNGYNAFLIVVTYLAIALILFKSKTTELFLYPFIFAAVMRFASLIMLIMQTTAPLPRQSKKHLAIHNPFWTSKPILYVILFTTLFRFVTNVATPFLIPYMMEELHFNLIQYAWLIAVPFIGRSVMFSRWGETMRSHSPLIVLQICMTLISMNCFLWSELTSVIGLGSVEFIAGVAWGGFELAGILLMQSFRPGRARGLIGFHLALTNAAAIGGALLGSYLFSQGLNYIQVLQSSAALRFSVTFAFIVIGFQIHPPKIHLRQVQDCFITIYRQFIREP